MQEDHASSAPIPPTPASTLPHYAVSDTGLPARSAHTTNLTDSSPHHIALSPNSTVPKVPSLDDLAPTPIVEQVVGDWFERIHPLAPILHRDTFLRQLADGTNHTVPFINLVISLCAATVSTLRSRGQAYSGMITVEKCHDTISENERQTGNPPSIDLLFCQTKYNLATSLFAARGIDDPKPQLLLAEVAAGTNYLLHYHCDNMQLLDRELIKRLYWLCFAGQW